MSEVVDGCIDTLWLPGVRISVFALKTVVWIKPKEAVVFGSVIVVVDIDEGLLVFSCHVVPPV